MKKLTKVDIENLANDIKDFLVLYGLATDVNIYYNGKVDRSKYYDDINCVWKPDDNVNPHDYFQWAAYDHILSMAFEGALYHAINYSGYKIDEFDALFEKYGLYYELGNAWNLTCYPLDDDMEIEYTKYAKPKKAIELYRPSLTHPQELNEIMQKWYDLSASTGDLGCCVLGAGFEFEWNGNKYRMLPQSPYQGSVSWEKHIDTVKQMLKDIGATEIYYDWGNMD